MMGSKLEMLAKLAGYNELEKDAHQHIEVKVDAIIEQLRAGYENKARGNRGAKLIALPSVADGHSGNK